MSVEMTAPRPRPLNRLGRPEPRADGQGSFPCPSCGEKTTVYDSRPSPKIGGVRRRRRCLECGNQFRTYEMTAASLEADPLDLKIRQSIIELNGLIAAYLEREAWDET